MPYSPMMTTPMPELPSKAVPEPEQLPGLRRAYSLLWLTFFIFFASTGAGKLWDRVWHATRRFDTFWSPPHFFVFVMTLLSGLLVASIAFTPGIRAWFGPTVRVPLIKFPVPGSLAMLGGGLIALCITITLDNFWHTAFGLDETQWSMPHDMLGWCWLTIILGFVAARLAFRKYRPLNWITTLLIALLVLEFLCSPILGPFYLNYSPELLHGLANLPIVRTEPTAEHMYRIYLHFGLTRQTSFLFIPMAGVFAGAALAFLRALDSRARIFLLAPLAWSIGLMGRDLYTILFLKLEGASHVRDIIAIALREPSLWVPIPLLAAALIFTALQHTSFREGRCYAITGLLFGLCTFAIWHTSPWMILLALPASVTTLLGSWLGKWLYRLIEYPTFEGFIKWLSLVCAELPAVLGIVDLILRRLTP